MRAYVADEASLTGRRLRDAARRPDPARGRPSRVLRLGRARDRGRGAAGRHRRAPREAPTATRTRRCRVASSRSSGRPAASASRTRACSPARCVPRQRVARRRGRGRRRRPRSASSPRPVRRVATSWWRVRWRRSAGSARSGSTMRSANRSQARRRRPGSRARRSRPSSFARTPDAAGLASGRPGPARRAGPAHRRPPGRGPPRDRRVAVRRGPEGGHPGDAGARLRHRSRLPRDDHGLHRAPGPGRGGRGGHPRQDQDEHHGPELAAEHEPVHGHAGPADRAGAVRLRDRVPVRRRAPLHPALPVQDASTRWPPRWRHTSARR